MGGLFGGGQDKAAKIAQQTATQNNAFSQGIYDSNKALEMPTIDRGNAAGSAYNALLGLGGDAAGAKAAFDTYKGSDGYQFRLSQGLDAVNAGAFAKGGGLSGATLKALNDYAGDSASSEFGKYLGELQTPMALGQSATGALAGQGTTLAATTAANNNTASAAAQQVALANGGVLGKLIGTGVNIASSFVNPTSTAGKILGRL
jgi:hypothetical protein